MKFFRRLLGFVVAIVVAGIWLSRGEKTAEVSGPGFDTTEQGKYRPTTQEGLGASIAILLDNSGSMDNQPDEGGSSTKAVIAREVLEGVLAQTDSFVAKQPGFPVNVGLYVFSGSVERALPIGPWDHGKMRAALDAIPSPQGGTAIGDAMNAAITDLYGAGTIRKYILVVTDGESNEGADPAAVASEIARRSEGAVRLFLVAFDIDPEKFGFIRDVRGTLIQAGNALSLRAGLDTLYRGRILAEAVDAGETLLDTLRRP